MLLLMAIDMMRARRRRPATTAEEQGEPARATTWRSFRWRSDARRPGRAGHRGRADDARRVAPVRVVAVFIAVAITCARRGCCMRGAASAERFLPKNLLRALERIMGLLLAAVAIEFIGAGSATCCAHPDAAVLVRGVIIPVPYLTLVVVAIGVAALWWWLSRTPVHRAVGAGADDPAAHRVPRRHPRAAAEHALAHLEHPDEIVIPFPTRCW